MSNKLLCTLALLVFSSLFFPGWKPKTAEFEKKTDSYLLSAGLLKTPPPIGPNKIAILVKDFNKKIITSANVSITYGTTAGASSSETTMENGTYTATLNFTKVGLWLIDIQVTEKGKASEKTELKVDVH